jgi:hypothetical protein
MADSKGPTITSLLKNKQKSVSVLKTINYRFKDDLSGVKSYKVFVNQKFYIAEMDASSAILTCNIKKMNLKAGKNEIVIQATDERGNVTVYKEVVLF